MATLNEGSWIAIKKIVNEAVMNNLFLLQFAYLAAFVAVVRGQLMLCSRDSVCFNAPSSLALGVRGGDTGESCAPALF